MKKVLEYLNECKDMAAHNRLCYSDNLLMNGPKEGFEKEYAEAVRDGEIVDELIAMVKEKEAPAKQTPPWDCPCLKLFRELDEYVQANGEGKELREDIKQKIGEYGIPKALTVDHG